MSEPIKLEQPKSAKQRAREFMLHRGLDAWMDLAINAKSEIAKHQAFCAIAKLGELERADGNSEAHKVKLVPIGNVDGKIVSIEKAS